MGSSQPIRLEFSSPAPSGSIWFRTQADQPGGEWRTAPGPGDSEPPQPPRQRQHRCSERQPRCVSHRTRCRCPLLRCVSGTCSARREAQGLRPGAQVGGGQRELDPGTVGVEVLAGDPSPRTPPGSYWPRSLQPHPCRRHPRLALARPSHRRHHPPTPDHRPGPHRQLGTPNQAAPTGQLALATGLAATVRRPTPTTMHHLTAPPTGHQRPRGRAERGSAGQTGSTHTPVTRPARPKINIVTRNDHTNSRGGSGIS
jgi:hypothetical protein